MAVVSTRTDRKRFQYLRRVAGQCRTGNRRRRTVPATEPKRAAVEIALGCTCATETRAEGEVPSIRGAPSGRPERPQSGGADRCVAPLGYGHFCLAPPLRPTQRFPFVYVQWQQIHGKDIDAARTNATCNTLQVGARRLFRQQMTKGVDQAVSRISRSTETKFGHLGCEGLSLQPPLCKLPSKVTQSCSAQIEAGHFITSSRQSGD